MRVLSPQFAAALQGGATTLCHCWRLRPRQGAALGFTDHDRDLAFDNTTFSAATGLEASALEAKLGFAVGGGEVSGALVSAAQTQALATIQRLDPIYVDIQQSSSDLLALRRALSSGGVVPASASVKLKLEDGSDYPLGGTVEF